MKTSGGVIGKWIQEMAFVFFADMFFPDPIGGVS